MDQTQGEPWPVGRASHRACCLNYGGENPQLLVSGGRDNDKKTLGDMWILDVESGKWKMVRFTKQKHKAFIPTSAQTLDF